MTPAHLSAPGRSGWRWRPRRTARLRLTLLSAALFLLAGATLLGVTYLLFHASVSEHLSSHGRSTGVGPATIAKTHGLPGGGPSSYNIKQISGAISAASAQAAAANHDLLVDSAIALAIVGVLAIALAWFVTGRMLRPLRTITATARRISATSLHERLALDGADEEFKELGDTLDDLFSRLEAAFEAQRHFVANASHELRTPLTAERTLLQVALDDPETTNATWRSTAEEVLASSDEQERLIEALLTLASSEGGLDHYQRLDLGAIGRDIVARPHPDLERLGLQLETSMAAAPLDGDGRLIERLVANLVDNACGHNVVGGYVQISTNVSVRGEAVLVVRNTGPVISPDEISRLFQPFQRLDARRTHHHDGHGLGLSIVRAIVNAHRAAVTAQPSPQGGLEVTVTFPPPTDANPPSPAE